MNIAAVSLTPHDCSLCIIKDGDVYGHFLEERLSTEKHDGTFFFLSEKLNEFEKKYGLEKIFLSNGDSDDYAHLGMCLAKYNINVHSEIIKEEHHLYHASSAYYASGFDEAVCLVMDGWGANHGLSGNGELITPWGASDELISIFDTLSEANEHGEEDLEIRLSETTSVYSVKNNNFELVYKNYYTTPTSSPIPMSCLEILHQSDLIDINANSDIGMMYGSISEHLGYSRLECGKTMGLSSYGKEDPELPSFVNDTKLFANSNVFSPGNPYNLIYNSKLLHYDDFQKKANIAYKLQKTTEDAIVLRVGKILEKYPDTKNLTFSGGVALNICANSAIKKAYPDLNLFIDPIASDACQAYGMAKFYSNCHSKKIKNESLKTIYLGPNYNSKSQKINIEIAVAKENKKRYNNVKGKF